jgi:hypothetical protein
MKSLIDKPKPAAKRWLPVQRANALKVHGLGKRPEPEYISAEDLCIRWRLDRASIKYYCRKGILKPLYLTPRKMRFALAEIRRMEREAGVCQPGLVHA